MSAAHLPVMLTEAVAALAPRQGETHVDATFGAGGYTRAILAAADCRVVAIDRDPDAIAEGQELAQEFAGRLMLSQGRLSELEAVVAAQQVQAVDGVAMDLGVSSMQLDRGDRGFAFSLDGPLDMRMSRSGPTAADVVNALPEAELARIIYEYGGERRSRRVAHAIVAARAQQPITRSRQLAEIVARALGRVGRIHPATRTFQAIRIHVNDEMAELRSGLHAAERLLAPDGRLVVVSFHSLEDREVKAFLAARSGRAAAGSRHLPAAPAGADATFRLLRRKAARPSESEIRVNPRARSARLRAAVRTAAPVPASELAS